jgi:hypothetical protein
VEVLFFDFAFKRFGRGRVDRGLGTEQRLHALVHYSAASLMRGVRLRLGVGAAVTASLVSRLCST